MAPPVLETLRIPFSRAIPWYGANSVPIDTLKPFQHYHSCVGGDGEDNFLLGCLKTPDAKSMTAPPSSSSSCVLYLHGFPDQSVDHRMGEEGSLLSSYGRFSSRMSRKLSESFDRFCAFNFSGSPGSTTCLSFRDKTVTQEVWDVLNVMGYLSNDKSIGAGGFHIVGLSTGAIIGALLRGVSTELRHQLELPPILSITVIASCGASSNEKALEFDFDQQQQEDFDAVGYCWKQFWLPKSNPNNPDGAVLKDKMDDDEGDRWVPHLLKLDQSYRDDFLTLPIRQHLIQGNDIPLLVIHGKQDTNVPLAEGFAVFEAASEPKRFVEIPKGNHLLTNSKDMKKAIRAIQEWHKLHDNKNNNDT